jgi:hypothetical protein
MKNDQDYDIKEVEVDERFVIAKKEMLIVSRCSYATHL